MITPKRPVGRPNAGTVKLTCNVKRETRAALGDLPGARIDELVKKEKEGNLGNEYQIQKFKAIADDLKKKSGHPY